jgi:K+-sensing histidine kinase KdpD
MEGILSNLLTNAIKYKCEIKPLKYKCRSSKDKTILTFTDNGIGMNLREIKIKFSAFTNDFMIIQ